MTNKDEEKIEVQNTNDPSNLKKEKPRKKVEPDFFSFENFKSLAILVFIIFVIRWSIISPYVVPTGSMLPTILEGDRILVLKMLPDLELPFTSIKLLHLRDVKVGDIVVFRYPLDPKVDYVKRVVGVAGDRVKIVDDTVYVNDVAQKRLDFNHSRQVLDDIDDRNNFLLYQETLGDVTHWVMNAEPKRRRFSSQNWPQNGGHVTIPKDSVFVLGDNRDNSLDSRVWGIVPNKNIHGKAIMVLWSAKNRWHVRNRFGHWLDGDVRPNTKKQRVE